MLLAPHPLAVILVACVAWAPPAAAEAPQTSFFQANTLYADGRFAEAAEAYERLASQGFESGALRYNLGNTYAKLGAHGRALLEYERAARWMPGDPDLQANLDYVRSLTGAEPCRRSWWERALFPLAARASGWSLAVGATVVATLGFVALAGARWFDARRRFLRGLAATCCVLWLLAASSMAYRLAVLEAADRVLVVADETVAVRFEPATDGTTHFEVVPGTPLRAGESRADWLQVSRCDGRRGWIESSAVERL